MKSKLQRVIYEMKSRNDDKINYLDAVYSWESLIKIHANCKQSELYVVCAYDDDLTRDKIKKKKRNYYLTEHYWVTFLHDLFAYEGGKKCSLIFGHDCVKQSG